VVFGGMVSGTLLVVIFAPLFYMLVDKFFGGERRRAREATLKA